MSLKQVTFLYLAIAPILGLFVEGSITFFSGSVVFIAGILFYWEAYASYDRWRAQREED